MVQIEKYMLSQHVVAFSCCPVYVNFTALDYGCV